MTSAWTDVELAYFAGIIDGEGTITLAPLSRIRPHLFHCRLFVSNTDARLLAWIRARFGGTVIPIKTLGIRNRPLLRWTLSGKKNLVPLFTKLLPYLVIKREHADLALAYFTTLGPVGSHPISEDVRATRIEMKSQFLSLNKRGA